MGRVMCIDAISKSVLKSTIVKLCSIASSPPVQSPKKSLALSFCSSARRALSKVAHRRDLQSTLDHRVRRCRCRLKTNFESTIEMPRINIKHVSNCRRKYKDHIANQHRKALNRRCEKIQSCIDMKRKDCRLLSNERNSGICFDQYSALI
jgi:hypothetical protein